MCALALEFLFIAVHPNRTTNDCPLGELPLTPCNTRMSTPASHAFRKITNMWCLSKGTNIYMKKQFGFIYAGPPSVPCHSISYITSGQQQRCVCDRVIPAVAAAEGPPTLSGLDCAVV